MAMYTNCFDQVSMMSTERWDQRWVTNLERTILSDMLLYVQSSIVPAGHSDCYCLIITKGLLKLLVT